MTEAEEAEVRRKLRDDFAHYAPRCLVVRAKTGGVVPFGLNRVQSYLHERIEAQLAHTGKVRAIVLKGRQEGCSTYIEGRFYWKVTHRRGMRAFILTHEQEATDNLFGMAQRFHDNCPPLVQPVTGAANAKELAFPGLDSDYKVGTAGTKAVGRSQTIQYLHASEVGFWSFAETHAAGVMQAVPNEPGTEIILESTANGMGNFFHSHWQDAERGKSDYEAIFIPWFWCAEYRTAAPAGFSLSSEDAEYQEAHGLDLEQMAWRATKIAELKDEKLFRQEYPATSAEAFQISGDDTYIPGDLVLKARKSELETSETPPLLVGVDPARFGKDRTSIIRRRGRVAFGLESHVKKTTMQVAGIIATIINTENPRKVFLDVGGLGVGIYDRLVEVGYGRVVVAVNSGESAVKDDRYINLRAEMWGKMKEWLEEPGGARIPDSDILQADLTGPRYSYDSSTRLRLERKEDMKKRGLASPDDADALAQTFAVDVGPEKKPRAVQHSGAGAWMG